MVEEMKKRAAYAQAVIAAGDRHRKEMDAANKDCKEEMDKASERFRERMHHSFHIYDEELKAAAIQYEREDK